MAKLFGGILVFITGLSVAVASYYCAWVSSTPGFSTDAYLEYQRYSMVLGVSSIGIMVAGIYMVIASIRKMNRDYKESKHARGPRPVGQG